MLMHKAHHCCIVPLLRVVPLCFTLISFPACQSKYISFTYADHIETLTINRIALVPFKADATTSGESFEAIVKGASILTRLVEGELDPCFYLIPHEEVENLLSTMPSSLEIPELARKIGSTLHVDAVVMGFLFRLQPREGTPYAVTTPASAAFELYLLDGKSGNLLWKARFDKTQKSLSEDLGNFSSFIKGEWRWLTADELMEQGVKEILDTFPDMKRRKQNRKLKPLPVSTAQDVG